MSRQATKADLERIAGELGVSYDYKPTVDEVRADIVKEFRRLHSTLALLGFGDAGVGSVHANQKRLQALYASAPPEMGVKS